MKAKSKNNYLIYVGIALIVIAAIIYFVFFYEKKENDTPGTDSYLKNGSTPEEIKRADEKKAIADEKIRIHNLKDD